MLNKTTNLLYATITAKYKYYEKHRKKTNKKTKNGPINSRANVFTLFNFPDQTQFPVPFPLALPGSSQSERNRTSHHLHANQTYPYLEFITKDSHTEDNAPARYRRDLTKRKTKGCVRGDMYVSFAGPCIFNICCDQNADFHKMT